MQFKGVNNMMLAVWELLSGLPEVARHWSSLYLQGAGLPNVHRLVMFQAPIFHLIYNY